MTIIPAPGLDATRVSIRRRRPSGALSDVVGHLVAANDEWMVVLPEDRGAEWVPRAEAEAVRKVPERTVLPASPAVAYSIPSGPKSTPVARMNSAWSQKSNTGFEKNHPSWAHQVLIQSSRESISRATSP